MHNHKHFPPIPIHQSYRTHSLLISFLLPFSPGPINFIPAPFPSFSTYINNLFLSTLPPSPFNFTANLPQFQFQFQPTMTNKPCDKYYCPCKRHLFYRRLFAAFLAFIILVLFVIFVIWIVLRPTKPKFYLRDLTVLQFNLTGPALFSATLQTTISSKNPNDRIGIYYDRMDVYAEYKNQRVTIPTALPTGYQGHHDFAVWSPFLYGAEIAVSPYLSDALGQDENAGFVLITVKIDGRLRWKVGTWVSGHYHINIHCPAFLTVGNGNGNDGGCGFKFTQITTCSVDV